MCSEKTIYNYIDDCLLEVRKQNFSRLISICHPPKGLCILAASKKKPFLADPKFLKYKGFTVCDESDNGIQLWYLPFGEEVEKPKFRECAKHPHIEERGYRREDKCQTWQPPLVAVCVRTTDFLS